MTPHDLLAAFETLAEAPDGIARLRELVLQLAVRGKLVSQDPNDEPARVLLERIAAEKARLVKEGKIAKLKPLPPVDEDEVSFEVPKGWEPVRLVELGFFMGGKTPSTAKAAFWMGGIPWISPKDMKASVIVSSEDCVSQAAIDDGLHLIPSGSVLVVVRSGILRHTVPVAVNAVDCTINQDLKALILYPVVLPEYVRLIVQGFESFILGHLTKTGTTVESMKFDEFSTQPFLFPPLPEQHRIIAKVDALMALLDHLETTRREWEVTRAALRDAALIALREATDAKEVEIAWTRIAECMDDLFIDSADVIPLRQAILQLAVRGKLAPQVPNDEPAYTRLERIAAEKAQLVKNRKVPQSKALLVGKEEIPFEVPEGWVWVRLQDLASTKPRSIQSGPFGSTLLHSEFITHGRLVIGIDNVQDGEFSIGSNHRITEDKFRELERYRARPGDVLITIMGTVGRCCVVPDDIEPAIVTKHVYRITLAQNVCVPRYLMYLLNGTPAIREQISGQVRGLTREGLNGTIIKGLVIPLPPLPEQHRIVAKVDALMALCDTLEVRLTAAHEAQAAFAAAAVHHLDV